MPPRLRLRLLALALLAACAVGALFYELGRWRGLALAGAAAGGRARADALAASAALGASADALRSSVRALMASVRAQAPLPSARPSATLLSLLRRTWPFDALLRAIGEG